MLALIKTGDRGGDFVLIPGGTYVVFLGKTSSNTNQSSSLSVTDCCGISPRDLGASSMACLCSTTTFSSSAAPPTETKTSPSAGVFSFNVTDEQSTEKVFYREQ